MPQTKEQKKKTLEELRDKVARQKAIVLLSITGIKVKDISELRKKLKAIGAELKVVKKTLANIIFKENKMEFDKKSFKTEVGFVFGFEDEVSPAKTAYQFSKENEALKILEKANITELTSGRGPAGISAVSFPWMSGQKQAVEETSSSRSRAKQRFPFAEATPQSSSRNASWPGVRKNSSVIWMIARGKTNGLPEASPPDTPS